MKKLLLLPLLMITSFCFAQYTEAEKIIDKSVKIGNLIIAQNDFPDAMNWDDAKKSHDDNKWNYGLGIEPGAFNNEKGNVEITFINNKVEALRTYNEPLTFDTDE